MTYPLIIGDTIEHPTHGTGTITFVGADYIGIEFNDGRHALLKRDRLQEDLASANEAPEVPVAHTEPERSWSSNTLIVDDYSEPDIPWPENTFVADDNSDRHAMGSHWHPFAEEPREILERLPAWLPEMQPFLGYGAFYKAPRPNPGDWAQGFSLCWPDVHCGLIAVAKANPEGNEIVSLFPYFERGIEVRLTLAEVTVWESGLEAQIRVDWGYAVVDFFDVAFVSNRGWYESGKAYDFILLGIAYSAEPAEAITMPVSFHPEQLAWEAALAEDPEFTLPPPPDVISLVGMAMMLPVPDRDADEYRFRGPVKSVMPVPDVLGQPAWRLLVTVFRFDDVDADLAILVTERAWQGDGPPEVGMDIEGALWLQGRLSSTACAGFGP